MEANFVLNCFRTIVATIDRAIYYIISILYEILGSLTSPDLVFSQDQLYEFSARIYTFVGLVMLFKVTFSLISYLVNPDVINDKTNGAGNIAKNIVITLFLIILVPYAFDFLYRAQNAIISDNILPKLILGTTDDTLTGMEIVMDQENCGDYKATVTSTGEFISIMALRPFYQLDSTAEISDDFKKEYCKKETINGLLSPDIYKADEGANDQNNIGKYLVDYRTILSTICGAFVLFLLLTACMDIALRAIKLGFLELIAPVPIISYVDPKSGKDGMFKKWTHEVIKTWASLFVRLATIYFAIYVVELVGNSNLLNESHGVWVTLFLIIGALMFAKQAPKLIEDIFGIKFDGLALSPVKKFKKEALGGEALAKVPGKVGAAAIGGAVAGAGFAIGRNLKMKDIRENQRNVNSDTKKLQQLRGRMLETKSALANARAAGAPTQELQNTYNSQKAQFAELNKSRHDSIAKLNAAKAKYEKSSLDDEGNKYFSAAHPAMAGAMQALRGVKGGLSAKDTKGLSGTIAAGLSAAKTAVKRTNDFDKFGYLDRLRDLGTDLTGVKNESGTTSIVKDHLKQQRESLRDIESALRAQEVRFGNLPAGMINMVADEKGKHSYVVADASSRVWEDNKNISRDSVINEVDNWKSMRQAQRDIEKSNKEYESVLAINESKGK